MRALKIVATLMLALGLPLLAYGSTRMMSQSQAGSELAAPVAKKQASTHTYGIASSFYGLSQAQLMDRMAGIKQTGATWVRYDLSWDAVQQKGRDSYDWSVPDRITSAAVSHGLKVVMILDFTPPYQRVPGCAVAQRCAPVSPEAYAVFAGKAAEHCRPFGVNTWEVWNEPNIAFRFGPATHPAKYVAMLRGAYTAIKQVDPTSTVIAANTAPAASEHGDLRPIDFLSDMYDEGAQGYFDAIAAHPYTYPLTPAESVHDDAWGQMTAMHELMAAHGDGDKRIWITEFGAPTSGRPVKDDYVTEAVQAQTVTEATTIFRQFPWSGPLFWYNFQDNLGSSSENYFGLIRSDGSHKPAYDAFVEAARRQ